MENYTRTLFEKASSDPSLSEEAKSFYNEINKAYGSDYLIATTDKIYTDLLDELKCMGYLEIERKDDPFVFYKITGQTEICAAAMLTNE